MAVIIHEDTPRQPWMSDNVYAWYVQEEEARCNSQRRLALGYNRALIAVKAQHPLNPDGTPGLEYEERLAKALDLAQKLEAHNHMQVTLMTFGGVHDGCATTSLAESGANWLKDHGIDGRSIIINSTVYSGNDEDDLAAQEFANDPTYRELHIVLSAGQYERTRLYFISAGYQPFLHPVVYLDAKPHHSTVCEVWGTWPGSINDFKEGGLTKVQEAAKAIRQRHHDEFQAFQKQQTP